MCLTIKKRARKTKSSKDITVYKHLLIYEGKFFTPYQCDRVSIPSTVEAIDLGRDGTEVEEGIHSFANRDDAISDMIDETSHGQSLENRVVVECIIPKDTYYYKGTFDDMQAYVSLKLKYVKIV